MEYFISNMINIKSFLKNGYAVVGIWPIDSAPRPNKKEKDLIIKKSGPEKNIYIARVCNNIQAKDNHFVPVIGEEELKVAREAYHRDQQPLEFSLKIVCEVTQTEEDDVEVCYCVERIKQVLDWDVKKENNHKFSISFTINPDEIYLKDEYINKVKNLLYNLSLKNKMAFEARKETFNPSVATRSFPSHMHVGKQTSLLSAKIEKEDIESINGIKEDNLKDLVKFYGSITKGDKIAVGYSILEKVFDVGGENILSNAEKKRILNKLKSDKEEVFDSEVEEKIKVIKKAIGESHFMFKRTKNERIAFNISRELDNEKEEEVLEMIKGICKNRAVNSHKLEEPEKREEANSQIKFIERIISKKFNI